MHGAPEVFNVDSKPWVAPDNAEAKAIAAVIKRCPTGALHYQASDSSLAERAEPSNTLTIVAHGPLYLRGSFVVVTEDEKELLSDTRAALCRCGASKNKPFCDNSHFAVGFDDPGTAAPGADARKEDGHQRKVPRGSDRERAAASSGTNHHSERRRSSDLRGNRDLALPLRCIEQQTVL